jgi:hypothetical protein
MKRTITYIAGIVLLIMQYSCFTMKYSTTGASIPVEAKTVSVQFFENRAPLVEATLSQQVTDALKDYIQVILILRVKLRDMIPGPAQYQQVTLLPTAGLP